MSVEKARRAAYDNAWNRDDNHRTDEIGPLLDRLILEVQAEMPCYRLFDDHMTCGGEKVETEFDEDGDLISPIFLDEHGCRPCSAKKKLAEVAEG